MTEDPSTIPGRHSSTVGKHPTAGASAAEAARRLAQDWDQGIQPNLPVALVECPQLVDDRSVLLDLVQKEYRLWAVSEGPVSPDAYVGRFSHLSADLMQSIHRLVEVEAFLEANPGLIGLGEEPAWPCVGDAFAGVTIDEEVARNAVSRVFLGREFALGGRRVVMKVTDYPQHEASILGQLNHPNIVPIYHAGAEEEALLSWICMPYLGKRTLQTAIAEAFGQGAPRYADQVMAAPQRQPRPLVRCWLQESYEEWVIRVAVELSGALRYLQEQGILHGDLKPSNILLTDEGNPLLIDFNLARDRWQGPRLAGGTLPYMAPELLRTIAEEEGAAGTATSASDVFSLGVLLFELLLGRRPASTVTGGQGVRETAAQLLRTHAEHWPSVTRELNGYSPSLVVLVKRCLAISPDERPDGFHELERTLRRMSRPLNRLARGVRRAPLRTGLAATLAIVVIAASGFAVVRVAESHSLAHAENLVATRRYEAALALLDGKADGWDASHRKQWLMAEALVRLGRHDEALERYRTLSIETRDPLAYMMSGFCLNFQGKHIAAIGAYEKARSVGASGATLELNQAKSIMLVLNEHYDRDHSLRVETMLLDAYQLAPNDEAVRLAMFTHARLVSRKKPAESPSYPTEVAELPADRVSVAFLVGALRLLTANEVPQEEVARLGFPCLARLKAVCSEDLIKQVLGSECLATLKAAPGYGSVAALEGYKSGRKPTLFGNPLAE